ncbi:MAG: ATP-binding cassette domain-containing protein [Opitutaceae bacterium]
MTARRSFVHAARMPAAHPPILEVLGLSIERGSTRILHQVNWRVERGQNWIVLGANGSGKTSLLRALTGYLPPTAGRVSVLGEVYGESDWRELRLQIGLVTSALQPHVPPAEPAIETVLSGKFAQLDLWAKTTEADRAAAARILRRVDAASIAAREWGLLSQGERQRVLIGRALIARPRLLILDEPCAGLDPVARAQFLTFLDHLALRPGAPALVLVTHHVEEITSAFTHALVLRAGEVMAVGPKERVVTSAVLSRAFGARLRVRARSGRFKMV